LGAALETPNPATFYDGGEKGFTDYPTMDKNRIFAAQ
jgi:N-ethylmaleimide reductase